MTIKRPCLNCGELTTSTTRCATCQGHRDKLYQGDYRRQAAHVKATATVCWLCGEPEQPDDPFTADHVIPSNPMSELRAAHRSCNSARKDLPAHTHRQRRNG